MKFSILGKKRLSIASILSELESLLGAKSRSASGNKDLDYRAICERFVLGLTPIVENFKAYLNYVERESIAIEKQDLVFYFYLSEVAERCKRLSESRDREYVKFELERINHELMNQLIAKGMAPSELLIKADGVDEPKQSSRPPSGPKF